MIPDWRILGPLMAGLVALFGWLAKHISNTNKHPCKSDIVFRDVCDERSKNLEDCIESAMERSEQRYQELKQDTKEGFVEIKQDMKDGFTEIKTLISKNGG